MAGRSGVRQALSSSHWSDWVWDLVCEICAGDCCGGCHPSVRHTDRYNTSLIQNNIKYLVNYVNGGIIHSGYVRTVNHEELMGK